MSLFLLYISGFFASFREVTDEEEWGWEQKGDNLHALVEDRGDGY